MSEYKLYSLDTDGKITSAEWIDANNDHEALFVARAHRRSAACEVWEDNRLVGRVADFSNSAIAQAQCPGDAVQAAWS